MELETKRLIIRPLEAGDLEDFYEYASNENVGGSSTWKPHESLEESREILHLFLEEEEYYGIHSREDQKLIGILGLHEDPLSQLGKDSCLELGYGLNYHYWHQGLMTEAASSLVAYSFKNLGIKRLTATTSEKNKRSQRVIEKLGLGLVKIYEGGWTNYRGDTYNKYYYSLEREDYLAQEKALP